ncbi:MAG: hypothetical protein COX62_01415 [Deltaproteobacteria bacterium CG_4_10_14_0_2_um_filter_43_8]|nr:MAG: hypothetical protein COV43_04425 [Deltaproteobacteria bacterium CG11_big_fil_rev_8_21_14_0_20_42_23]PJA21811.1 MAG: hypothetical protein COX62_01415 [Deltaproteobacteria bacterium CG_4_10_14_0_2_um_filter_43_8]PJC65020.1 MAG: hypothetical protein CO021_00815 [Deltaproteobacteria bacterium CG_4_9_14_0_2_um_filter_42_21]
MKKKLITFLIFTFLSLPAFAVINYPLENRTAAPIFEWALDLNNGSITIAAAGALDRQQMPDLQATSCTFQSGINNQGNIYIGGSTITNAIGTNEGLHIVSTGTISNVTVNGNANKIWIAGDNIGDVIKYLCN